MQGWPPPEPRRWAEMTRQEQRALLRTRDEAAIRAAMTPAEWRRNALLLVVMGLLVALVGAGLTVFVLELMDGVMLLPVALVLAGLWTSGKGLVRLARS